MDSDLFLQQLRDLSLEDGRAYIRSHAAELEDHAAFGNLLAEEALRVLYTPLVSLKLAELLIFFGGYVHHALSHALGLKAKGDALVQIGHYQAAITCLDAAGEEFLHLGDEGNWARSRISWIPACAWSGHVEEALQEAARARDVFLRLNEYYWVCVINNNTAVIYDDIGRYQDALKLYEDTRAIYPTLVDRTENFIKRSIGMVEVNQAISLAWLGSFEQAYYLLQQAQASFKTLGETSLVIYSETQLADLDYTQGYYGSALKRYYQARESLIESDISAPIVLAKLKVWIAKCLVKLNRAHEACPLTNEAVEMYRQAGISLDTGVALREYATTLLASGRSEEALNALNEARMLFDHGGFAPFAYATKLQQAEIRLELGFAAEAYDQVRFIKDYFETKGLVSHSIGVSLVMAGALLEIAEQAQVDQENEQQAILLQEAVSLCRQAALKARQHNLQGEVYKIQYLLGRLFAFQGNPKKAARHYGAAIAQIERILDDLAYDLSPSFLHTTWAVYEDMITLCLQQSQVELAFCYLEQARSMALRQYLNKSNAWQSKRKEQQDTTSSSVSKANSATMLRMQYELKDWKERYRDYSVLLSDIDASVSPAVDREVIEAQLKLCETKINELFERLHLYQSNTDFISPKKRKAIRNAKHVDIALLRQHLTPDQLLLAYFLSKDRLVIFGVTREQLVTREVVDGVPQLERLLPLLHAHLQPGGWPDPHLPPQQVIRRLLKKLYDLLVAPVTELLPPQSGSLTIVPYGPLHKLPFHALHDGSHFLIENFQINYLPASNILMHLSSHKNEQLHRSTDIPSSVRQPLVFGYSGNGQLQRTIDETKTLAAQLNGRCYLEGEATIAKLLEQAPGSPLIHIATHGRSRLDAPNFSYVLLADGQLNAIDAFSLDLKGCELVTLSGCETGLATSGGGDEQLGLGRAFLAAGAESLVMSLWPVEDNATNELMQIFYQHLLKGESKVQALRAAQYHLLHRPASTYTHPYFWAAFRLVGDVSPLSLKEYVLSLQQHY